MIFLNPFSDIIRCDDGSAILKSIELAGRTCYKSEKRITAGSARAFVAARIAEGHHSILRHEKATVRLVCNRSTSHQIVRHGLADFSQESQRYCNYGKRGGLQVIIPPRLRGVVVPGNYATERDVVFVPPSGGARIWVRSMFRAEEDYLALLRQGWMPEEARGVLPNDTKTEVVMTANLEEWRHVFRARTSPKADIGMRALMVPLLAEMKLRIPVVFDDIELPEARS